MNAAPVIESPRCQRCNSKLAHEARPCHVCIAPAVFTLQDGKIADIEGFERPESVKLPKFAQSPVVRGKNIRRPNAGRAIAVARTISKWTWNSVGIAACVHLVALIIALFLQNEIKQAASYVQRADIEQDVTAAPITAMEPDEIEAPELTHLDDDLVMPDQILNDPDLFAGEMDAPPDEIVFAPEEQVAPPSPNRITPNPFLRPDSGQGLGGGEPSSKIAPPVSGSGLFKNRQGDSRDAALEKHGGGADTEDAVNLGLAYLAKKQQSNGSWDPNDGFKKRPSWATSDNGYRGAVTALCTLPFLAAGHSPESGKYRRNVERAIKWLISNQTSDGCVAYRGMSQMYTHTVATLALCEAYGLTQDEEIGDAAEHAVRFLERSQGSGGGWDYRGYVTGTREAYERNDLSISGWGVLAFKSAKAVGIKVNERAWTALAGLYDRQSLRTGETYYADRAHGTLSPTRKGIGMVGVGLAARTILDRERFETTNYAAERLLLDELPDYDRFLEPSRNANNPNFNTFYGWYYATLGMFLLNDGRGPAWEKWNNALKSELLENQVMRGSRKGSWQADDAWIGPIMGDLYSTACAVLCLEVYYRYNPMHQTAEDIVRREPRTSSDSETGSDKPVTPKRNKDIDGQILDMDKAGHRSKYLRLLARDKGLNATAELIGYLDDESLSVRSTALYELGKLKPLDAVAPVKAMLTDPDDESLKLTVIDTLAALGDKSVYTSLTKLLRSTDSGVVEAARSALSKLADGEDFGTNKRAWENWFRTNT